MSEKSYKINDVDLQSGHCDCPGNQRKVKESENVPKYSGNLRRKRGIVREFKQDV